MASNDRKIGALLVVVGALGVAGPPAHALLPEPPNLYYGSVTVDGRAWTAATAGTVTLVLEGQTSPVASYAMGALPAVGNRYLLEVPLDALSPQAPGTARPGNRGTVYVNGTLAARAVIGERGRVVALNLALGAGVGDGDGDGVPNPNDAFASDPSASVDSDGDGYPDAWNPGKTEADSTTGITLDAHPDDPQRWTTWAIAVLSGVPPSPSPASSATITVGGIEVAAYRFQFDGGAWSAEIPVAQPIVLTGLAPGFHLLNVVAKTAEGVWQPEAEATPAAWTVGLPAGFTGMLELLLLR